MRWWNELSASPRSHGIPSCCRPANDPAFRETVFGSGHGIFAFHVNELARLIRIFNIVWIG